MNENNILGVVLAGGKSKRFGQDKNDIKLGNKTLLDHTLHKIKSKFKLENTASISIRPEKIDISDSSMKNSVKGQVISAAFVGNTYQYDVKTTFGNLYVVSRETNDFKKVDDEIYLTFDENFFTLLKD